MPAWMGLRRMFSSLLSDLIFLLWCSVLLVGICWAKTNDCTYWACLIRAFLLTVNPLTPRNYQHETSHYNILTLSSKQVMRIFKLIRYKFLSLCSTKFSWLIYKKNNFSLGILPLGSCLLERKKFSLSY